VKICIKFSLYILDKQLYTCYITTPAFTLAKLRWPWPMIKNWMNWEPSLIIPMYQTTLTNVYYLSLGSTSPSSSSGSLSGSSKVTLEQWSPLHSLSADWLHLNTFPHAEDALSRTRRFLNSWKTGFAVKASQRSSHLYRSKPWIQTCWSNWSSSQCWLTTPEILTACGKCSIKDQKVHQHLENRFRHEGKSML